MSTYSPKSGEITRAWLVIDAQDVVLGRLAVTAATLLRGKHKATYAPHVDGGDFVVVVTASKIALTGNKRTDKMAYRHSGRPGGLKAVPYGELLDKDSRKELRACPVAAEDSCCSMVRTGSGRRALSALTRAEASDEGGTTLSRKAVSVAERFT